MAEVNLKDLEAIQTSLKSISSKTTFDEVKKSIVNLADSLKDSLEEFQKNEAKARQRRTQLNATHLQEELKKRLDLNKKIMTWEAKQFDERFELNKRYHTRVVNELKKQHKEREFLEKRMFLRQAAMNKEFYGKIDESFKKLNDRTSKLAGKLDSVFGTGFFTSLQKISSLITGFTKNALKLTLGGLQFIQTAKQGGIKKAFAQTKIGKGIHTAKRTVRRAASTIRKITGAGVSGRIESRKEKEEAEKSQSGIAKGIGKTGKTQEAALIGQVKFFEWFKKFAIFKWLWEKANFAADKLSKLLGLGGEGGIKGLFKAGLGKFFSTGIGKFIGGTSGGLLQKTLTSIVGLGGAIGGIKGAIKGISQFGAVSKKYGGGAEGDAMGVAYTAKKISSGILSGLTLGLVSPKSMDKLINAGSRITEKFVDALSPNQKFYDKLSQAKTGLSKRSIDIGKTLDSIMEKTGTKGTGASQMKAIMADKEKWNKLNKEEQELVRKKVEGAKKLQQVAQLPANKPVEKKAAQGFPGIKTPTKLGDLFGKISRQTNLTVGEGGEEYLAVLNKEQYNDIKGLLGTNLQSFNLSQKLKPKPKTFMQNLVDKFKLSKKKESPLEDKPKDQQNMAPSANIDLSSFTIPNINTSIQKLQPTFKTKLLGMLGEYKKLSGKQAPVNEAYRDTEYQKKLYEADIAKKRLNPAHRMKTNKPGTSPHEKGIAADLNTADLDAMDYKYGLIDKYKLKRASSYSRIGPGKRHESWHVQAAEGAAFDKAPKDFMMKGHAGEGAFVAKSKEFTTVFKYFEMGKKLAEEASGAVKDVSMAFAKDKPGQALKNMQKEQGIGEGKDSKIVKLLSDIKTGIEKGAKPSEEKEASKSSPSVPPSTKGGEANYKSRSDVFPSDTMFTNMYALVSQFSGGY
jgi:hypothetical protein